MSFIVWFPFPLQNSLCITPEYCPNKTSENNDYSRYRAKESLCKDSVLEYTNGTLTAVTAMPYQHDTVIFVGTYKGQLLKVHFLCFELFGLSIGV